MAVWTKTGAGTQNKTQDFGETILGFSYTNVFGMKMTNVFGLAWNYYVGYTKFITGLDLTLDADWKIECFYAKCFKLGYATEYKMNTIESGKIEDSFFAFLQKEKKAAATTEETIGMRTTFSESVAESLGSRVSILSDDSTERDTYFSNTAGDEVLVAGTVSQTADSIEVTAALEHIITTALFNVNDSLEVL